ncbi:50S ribosomal protein L10 [Alphaproteobacteria bacterium]|nr:50S ribosomal protein L10 [Alphaproteobacteria bacterium]
MNYEQKREFVESLKKDLTVANLVLVTSQSGLTVDESTELRSKMRDAGANFRVVKNTLARLAVDGSKLSGMKDYFKGPTAVAFSEDSVAAARVVVDYIKTNPKLSIVAGMLGDNALDQTEVKSLASLPSLEVLRAKILGVLQAPATSVATVINGPASGLVRVISAHSEN